MEAVNLPRKKAVRRPALRHMVFLADLQEQSAREACIGAAEYAASKSYLDFEPWPLLAEGGKIPSPADLSQADSLMLTQRAYELVFGEDQPANVPCTFFLSSTPPPFGPSIEVNEEMVGSMAAEHLIGRGYPQVACVLPSGLGWAAARAAGFRKTCAKHGVPCELFELPAETLPIYWRSNFAKRHRQLHQIIDRLAKPCGVFAINDVIACFLIETARLYGVGMPHEIGVIGVDDDPVPNAAAGLSISSVQMPFREVGWRAAQTLDLLRQGKNPPHQLILPPISVVVRASTNTFTVQNEVVRKAQAYIEQNRNRPLRVQEVVRAVKTTTVTLGKHFVRHLNMTPSEYILLRRIDYANELLHDRKLNVQQISDVCGFHSCSYFCKIFRRVTGHSPGASRQIEIRNRTDSLTLAVGREA